MPELEASLTSRELLEWLAFHRLEPIGGVRGDYQAALIASTIANVHRAKGRPAHKVQDFLMFDSRKRRRPDKKAAGQQLVAYLRSKKQPAAGG